MRLGLERLELCKQTTPQTQRMNSHTNARLTLQSRASLVAAMQDRRLTLRAAATAFRVSERTVRKWVLRFRARACAERKSEALWQPGREAARLWGSFGASWQNFRRARGGEQRHINAAAAGSRPIIWLRILLLGARTVRQHSLQCQLRRPSGAARVVPGVHFLILI